jgi:hypothetical protein
MASVRLCAAIVAIDMTAMRARGSQISAAMTIIDQPSAHSTIPIAGSSWKPNCHPTAVKVSSATMSQSPRTRRKRLVSAVDIPRFFAMPIPIPARRKNAGAQKCVTHRVAKSAAVPRARFSGWKRRLVT